MYRIFADNSIIYDDTSPEREHKALSPVLKLAAGSAGSLSITLPPDNSGHSLVRRMGTTLRVERDREAIWIGRVLSEKKDLWNNRELFCEGALAFLNDTVYLNSHPEPGISSATVFEEVLNLHNGYVLEPRVADDRKIYAGTKPAGRSYVSDRGRKTSLDTITDLINQFGGILRMRYVNAGTAQAPDWRPYLDWLDEFPAAAENAQELNFGENLLDFTRGWDMADFVTYVMVEGAVDPNRPGGQHYTSGWCYDISPEPTPAQLYGRIEKWLDMPELTSDLDCGYAGYDYLHTQQFGAMSLEVTAYDLYLIAIDNKPLDLLERVRVISRPHGLDAWYVVTGVEIPLDDPGNTKFTLEPATVKYTPLSRTLTQIVWAQGNK